MWYVRPAKAQISLCKSVEHSMTINLLTEQHLEYTSLKEGSTDSSEYTLVKMPHCWKSYVMAQIIAKLHRRTLKTQKSKFIKFTTF